MIDFDVLNVYRRLRPLPNGRWLFSKALCLAAPYFSTISPLVTDLRPGHCEIKIRKRRSITNHLGSIHAIAMCNLAELCAGLCLDCSLDKQTMRWIPKGMTVSYIKKARTDLYGYIDFNPRSLKKGDKVLTVDILDSTNEKVFTAAITMQIDHRKEGKRKKIIL
ncbi:DUF4442 domain-containing protein [Bacteriovoracaceae bacterium]|nr:DUF4442 domain-containing protein [Bacteriovoracaceae bacterium]